MSELNGRMAFIKGDDIDWGIVNAQLKFRPYLKRSPLISFPPNHHLETTPKIQHFPNATSNSKSSNRGGKDKKNWR